MNSIVIVDDSPTMRRMVRASLANFSAGGFVEAGSGLEPSQPQAVFGASVDQWLAALEARVPRAATERVGAPAIGSLRTASR